MLSSASFRVLIVIVDSSFGKSIAPFSNIQIAVSRRENVISSDYIRLSFENKSTSSRIKVEFPDETFIYLFMSGVAGRRRSS